jgi:hypothetical protein
MKTTIKELDLILNTVKLYQEGHHNLDIEILKQVFHPKAHIFGYYKDKKDTFIASRDQYFEMLNKRKISSTDTRELSYTKLLSLDKTDTTVVVKVESLMSGTKYVSYLSMLKTDDSWKIINGLFHG